MAVRKRFDRISGDAYGLVRNADKVAVKLVISIEIVIHADGISPGRQIGFNAQVLRTGGNGKKPATDRLCAVARESIARGEDEIGKLAMRMIREADVDCKMRPGLDGCRGCNRKQSYRPGETRAGDESAPQCPCCRGGI